MMAVDVAGGDPLDHDCDILVVGTFTGGIDGPGVTAVLDRLGLPALPVTPDFRGDIGQHLALASPGLRCATVLFVGLGRTVATDAARLREAARVAAATGNLRGRVVTTLALVHPTAEGVAALAEGFQLGGRIARGATPGTRPAGPTDARSDSAPDGPALTILVPSSLATSARRTAERAATVARATAQARELVDTPPNHQPPAALAAQITDLAGAVCGVDVHDEAALADAGFGGMLGAATGSTASARLLELRYEPDDALGHVVLYGVGTTFASGGLGLQRGRSMEAGKAHMAGAATIAATCSALGDLDVRVRVTALIALLEQMPDGDAQRPDDVVTTRGGLTIEIVDAAATAVPVLADVLDLARVYEPDAIVDVTAVGPTVAAALGPRAGAVMGNDRDVIDGLLTAAEASGEQLWQLPLWDDLDRALRSPVADVVNRPPRAAPSALVAGLILRRVVNGVPWAHVDCGTAAFRPPTHADDDYRLATGYGVPTLLRWLEHRATP